MLSHACFGPCLSPGVSSNKTLFNHANTLPTHPPARGRRHVCRRPVGGTERKPPQHSLYYERRPCLPGHQRLRRPRGPARSHAQHRPYRPSGHALRPGFCGKLALRPLTGLPHHRPLQPPERPAPVGRGHRHHQDLRLRTAAARRLPNGHGGQVAPRRHAQGLRLLSRAQRPGHVLQPRVPRSGHRRQIPA